MNFPTQYCLPTKLLTKESYSWLITKLVSEGYKYDSKLEMHNIFDLWAWCGVNSHGQIHLYSNNLDYIDLDEEEFNNVLNEEFIREYLK